MDTIDRLDRTDIVSTMGGREVIDVDELVDQLNILVDSVNRIVTIWNDLSDRLRELTT